MSPSPLDKPLTIWLDMNFLLSFAPKTCKTRPQDVPFRPLEEGPTRTLNRFMKC